MFPGGFEASGTPRHMAGLMTYDRNDRAPTPFNALADMLSERHCGLSLYNCTLIRRHLVRCPVLGGKYGLMPASLQFVYDFITACMSESRPFVSSQYRPWEAFSRPRLACGPLRGSTSTHCSARGEG